MSLNIIRYLTFEISRTCLNAKMHAGKCPFSHPERYKFSQSKVEITDKTVLGFWRWCKRQGFRGIILWHMYNEPVMVIKGPNHTNMNLYYLT